MKKRFLALALALCMALSVPALAAADSMDNFRPSRTYQNAFSDLAADSPFYSNVKALYEYGLTVGRGDGTFGLRDSVTVGQTVIFAGRLRSLYRTGDAQTGPGAYAAAGQQAHEPYLLYLQAEGILGGELDGGYLSPATRAQAAHVLASILPESALPPVNDSLVTEGYASHQYLTDVTEYTPYYQDILTLYKSGVCQGSGPSGSYLPDAAISRGELAAMLTRLFQPELRVTPSWRILPTYSAEGAAYADLAAPGAYIAAPATEEELDQAVRYVIAGSSGTVRLRYGALTDEKARQVTERILAVMKSYCEQGYNAVDCTYSVQTGSLALTFYAGDLTPAQTEQYRAEALAGAIAVHDELWAAGQITDAMTEYEKARVYYDWICGHCAYDYSASAVSVSHLPYGLFSGGKAVCDGYTGAYNLLLKLEGIDCTALHNASHIWTVAELDGVEYHIDTTWGDASGLPNYRYFAMTEAESRAFHSW